MRFILLFTLIALLQPSFAQKQETSPNPIDYKGSCVFSAPNIKLGGNTVADARKYLLNSINNLKADKVGLVEKHIAESPGGWHYSFIQAYAGVEVYQAEIKINIDRNNIIRSVLDNSFDTRQWQINASQAKDNNVIAIDATTGIAVLAELIQRGHYELLQHNNEVIYSRDINSYADSTVTGKVFYPDPLTTAQKNYGGLYVDNSDTNAIWLTNEQRNVSFKADYSGGAFRLQSDYLILDDFDSPNIPIATSVTPVFNYNRSQSGFEDVNVFYHINRYRSHVDSLGFNMANNLVYADPHAVGGDDQSYFTPSNIQPRLYFGVGGVDDGEDADVIIHEYGHFLSYKAAPNTNNGMERNALDEAYGDYLAASYSAALGGTYNSGYVFNWDGHNQYWNGRIVNSSKKYPADNIGSIYARSSIWSAVLWGIHGEIGGPATDSLIYEAMYNFASNISMPDAAALLLEADTTLTGGKYYCAIYKHLLLHGLVAFYTNNPCGITGINSVEEDLPIAFMQQQAAFSLINSGDKPISFEILNATGQQVVNRTSVTDNVFQYNNSSLASGLYIVLVNYNGTTKGFKWLK